MSEEKKQVKHFNKATTWGRLDGVPEKKLSNEGKGKPYWRIKVLCPSPRGNAHAYGRLWSKEKAEALITYVKKNPGKGVKLIGFFNQYEKDGKTLSNFTWFEWQMDECQDPRAAFSLVGIVTAIQGDVLSLHLERQGSQPEDFKVLALEPASLRRITEGDVVQVKGYLRSKDGEDEFGDSDNSPILPYFADEDLKIREGDFT